MRSQHWWFWRDSLHDGDLHIVVIHVVNRAINENASVQKLSAAAHLKKKGFLRIEGWDGRAKTIDATTSESLRNRSVEGGAIR